MIIQIGTEVDESRILWKHKESDEWERADIDDLIEAYENRQKEPKPGDSISRRDALKPFCIAPDGTRIPEVDCDNFPVEFSVKLIKRHLLSLPSSEPKPVCEDAISRKWVLNEIINKVEDDVSLTDEQKGPLSAAKYIIRHAPPVEPERPKGEWVDREHCQVDEDAYEMAICSNCKAEITLEDSYDNFCPNCGADCRGEEDD